MYPVSLVKRYLKRSGTRKFVSLNAYCHEYSLQEYDLLAAESCQSSV